MNKQHRVPNEGKWLVGYTKPLMEQVALRNLESQAFEVYLPLYKKFKKTELGSQSSMEPMFPRYIFFRPTKEGQSLDVVRSTKGMSHIVRFGFELGVVSTQLIETLQQLEAEQSQVTLAQFNNFKVGQKVKLKHVFLGNLSGLVESVSAKRVAVLLELLGRVTAIEFEHHQVQAEA